MARPRLCHKWNISSRSVNRTLLLPSVFVEDLAAFVGERVRASRQHREMSVGALAQAAGVGKGSLSEIENGARNPTLGTLYAIADALEVPLAHLLDRRVGARIASPGMEARLLDVSTDEGRIVELYRLSFRPGAERRAGGHGAGVVEHLLVTAGRLRVGRLEDTHELRAGDCAEWISDVPHTYVALGSLPVEAVLVIRSPGSAARSSGTVAMDSCSVPAP
jgi:transcriptional regulator with XRE-family HTH domain